MFSDTPTASVDGVDERDATPPDVSRRQRWTPVLLGVAALAVLALLVAGVITVEKDSTRPAEIAPRITATAPTSAAPATRAPATTTAMPSPSAAPSSSAPPPVPLAPVTATASTMVIAPPPTSYEPGPDVRQRLHDLFPNLFPNP